MSLTAARSTFTEIFGWYGAVAIVLAYMLVSFDVVSSSSALYQLLNLTGATGIFVVSAAKGAHQPAAVNLVWALIAAVALVGILL
jgi:hypothetical protein